MLVATDIAARGIDVDALGHVVNFDVPRVPEDYIHRVGRTARAEATGDAFTFVAPDEESDLAAIERAIGRRLPRVTLPDFDYARPAGSEARGPARRAHRRNPRAQGGGTRAGPAGVSTRRHEARDTTAHARTGSRGHRAREVLRAIVRRAAAGEASGRRAGVRANPARGEARGSGLEARGSRLGTRGA